MEGFFCFVHTKTPSVWGLALTECVCRRPPSSNLLMLWSKLPLLIGVGYSSLFVPISLRSKCWAWLIDCTLQVPPPGKGSLYIRPLLIGTGPILGLAPSPEYTFLVFASPVRNYFKVGTLSMKLISLHIKEHMIHLHTPGLF